MWVPLGGVWKLDVERCPALGRMRYIIIIIITCYSLQMYNSSSFIMNGVGERVGRPPSSRKTGINRDLYLLTYPLLLPPFFSNSSFSFTSIHFIAFQHLHLVATFFLIKEIVMASTESAIPPAQTEAEMPTSPKAKGHRRGSSSVTDVYKPADLSMSTSKHLIV